MENMPNFDSLTPKEVMAWMESLADRKEATDDPTPSDDVDAPEIDPNSVAQGR